MDIHPKKDFLRLYKTIPVLFSLIFLITRGAFPAFGVPAAEPDRVSPLSGILETALENNPGLKAAFNRWQAALEQIPQVKALPEPRLNFSYFLRELETRVGPQQARVGIMQMFPWFGKLKLKGAAALEMARALEQVYEKEKLDLVYRIKKDYYEYYFVSRFLSVIGENIELLKYLEGVIRTKYTTGAVSQVNLLKVQVELDKLRDRQRSMQDRVVPIRARLNAAMNRPLRQALPFPGEIPMTDLQLDRSRMENRIRENNPELKLSDFLTAKEEIALKLAKKSRYPDFSLGVDYMLTGSAAMTGVADSGKDPLAAMLSIYLPLKHKKYRASVREAQARIDEARQQRNEKINRLLSRLEMVFSRVEDFSRKLSLYRDTLIPRARQAFEVTLSAFSSGKIDFISLIDSQRTLLSFKLEYERALTSLNQGLAELEMLTGKDTSASL